MLFMLFSWIHISYHRFFSLVVILDIFICRPRILCLRSSMFTWKMTSGQCYVCYYLVKFLSSGGVCWQTFNSTSGLCQKAMYLNTTSEDCCITKGIASLAWSPHESSGDIFYFNFLSGGADQCHRCHSEWVNIVFWFDPRRGNMWLSLYQPHRYMYDL